VFQNKYRQLMMQI